MHLTPNKMTEKRQGPLNKIKNHRKMQNKSFTLVQLSHEMNCVPTQKASSKITRKKRLKHLKLYILCIEILVVYLKTTAGENRSTVYTL